MISLFYIFESILDGLSLSISSKPLPVLLHSCPETTSELDVALTHEIASSILWGIGLVGIIILLCMVVSAVYKYKAQKLRLDNEQKKRENERIVQENKSRLESAWRCLNDYYKKKVDTMTVDEKIMAEASWKFLTNSLNERSDSQSDAKK